MTQEEKAKAYDKALEKARQLCAYPTSNPFMSDLQDIFPELKESEDERIRKHLIKHFGNKSKTDWNGMPVDKIIAWLEKQDSQDSQDNAEDVDILHRFSFYSYKDELNVLYLSGLYVNEECRNKGIGTKILEVADEVAKSLNCRAIRLKTKKDSDAERLYRTHGYNSLATEKSDEIWLEKQGNDMGISESTKKKLEDNLNKALEKETPESCNEFIEKQGEQKPADEVGNYDHKEVIQTIINEQKPAEWEPQTGDTFRKKGTTSPTYHLCDKREDGITFGFVENREVGISGGEITIFALRNDYELVERPKYMEDVVEELNKGLKN